MFLLIALLLIPDLSHARAIVQCGGCKFPIKDKYGRVLRYERSGGFYVSGRDCADAKRACTTESHGDPDAPFTSCHAGDECGAD